VGRLTTWASVALVAVVVVAAVVDSLRSGEEPVEARPDEAARALAADVESRAAIANRLRHEGIAGRLLYTDERCEVRAVTLPDLAAAPPPQTRHVGCSFSASPDGGRTATPGAAWSPDSRRVAVCRATGVYVYVGTERGAVADRHEGCIPAWRPDGALTFVRDLEVVDASGAVLVPRGAVRAAARRHVVAPDPPRLRIGYEVLDVAWPTRHRVALLLRIAFASAGRAFEPQMQVAFFERGRGVGTEDGFSAPWTRLDALRGLVAVRPGTLLDERARRLFPQVGVGTGEGEAVALSPDARWVAVGLQGRVTILSVRALRAGRFRSVTLPFAARDLAWR
jgi:hypothetical protein